MNEAFRATNLVRLLLDQTLKEGQTAVDATAGNGWDTLYLAKRVGRRGLVYAFDIQEKALEKTRELLIEHDCLEQVRLILDSHEKLERYVTGSIDCLVYNLGYLPGGDKTVITRPPTTLLSLEKGLGMMAPGGIVSLVTYSGHSGGEEENRLVEEYLRSLPSPPWHVLTWSRVNGSASAPRLLLVNREDAKRRH